MKKRKQKKSKPASKNRPGRCRRRANPPRCRSRKTKTGKGTGFPTSPLYHCVRGKREIESQEDLRAGNARARRIVKCGEKRFPMAGFAITEEAGEKGIAMPLESCFHRRGAFWSKTMQSPFASRFAPGGRQGLLRPAFELWQRPEGIC